jgi:ketosteroid isomerase-like protein
MANDNEIQIKNLIEKWAQAIRNGDIPNLILCHDQDLVMFDVPFTPTSHGLEDYQRTWELYFSLAKKGTYNITNMKIIANDNLAYCYGLLECNGGAGSGLADSITFRLTACLIKRNSEWLICHEHHSLIAECEN